MPLPMFTSKKRVDYLTRVVAIIHAALVTIFAYYGVFHLCEDPSKSVFTSQECLLTPKLFHVLSAVVTIGYLSFDLIATLVFNHENNTLTYQTYAHHVAGIVSFYAALVCKPQTSVFLIGAVANQFTEISTPFMNLR
jgi:TLC domain